MKSLLHKSLVQFIVCTIVVLLFSTPLFYLLTKYYYAEDLIETIEVVQRNEPLPVNDLESDLIEGITLQFLLIAGVLSLSLIVVMRIIAKRLWIPFDNTLQCIEHFTLEGGTPPRFSSSKIKEFERLNASLSRLIANNLKSYNTQKEFTENASHELQTPLAVFQSKLDLLLQQPDLTEEQAKIVASLYDVSGRLSRLNKNLLLLAKIENRQYKQDAQIDVAETLREALPLLENLTEGITVIAEISNSPIIIPANKVLLESMTNDLIINAVRHNTPEGKIRILLEKRQLSVSNTSTEKELDPDLLFQRFYRPSEKVRGNGLGLAIVKAICDYHGWKITYEYQTGIHRFIVNFSS